MTATYGDVPQPYRIQKRLALNQCFRLIRKDFGLPQKFAYVTFGGEDLYDAMDLVGVFNVRDHEIGIISYEHDTDLAQRSQECPVATTLSKVKTITIDIIPAQFPSALEKLEAIRSDCTFVYFLDYTGTFKDKEANDLEYLLDSGLMRIGDFLLVTSCLTPRVIHNQNIMGKYDRSFRLFFQPSRLDKEFRGRNHVDLLVAISFSRRESSLRKLGQKEIPSPQLLGKFKYRDSRSPMGLWLYRVERKDGSSRKLDDVHFDEFPHAFAMMPEPEVPNIFD